MTLRIPGKISMLCTLYCGYNIADLHVQCQNPRLNCW